MKKISSIFLLLFFVIILTGCNNKVLDKQSDKEGKNTMVANNQNLSDYPMSSAKRVSDKLEVYYFHRTARCYSCKTIGQYVKETIEQKYNEQTSNGLIDFREINVDLAENKEIAKKFQASGSSLFINRIIDNEDNIEQDIDVWKLVNNEAQFKNYLENKLNSYLGI